jgi:hypothetical protein
MVRGKDSSPFIKFYSRLYVLAPEFIKPLTREQQPSKLMTPQIVTEGKTDWKHLEVSLAELKQQGLYRDIAIEFRKSDDPAGAANEFHSESGKHKNEKDLNWTDLNKLEIKANYLLSMTGYLMMRTRMLPFPKATLPNM